MCAVSVKLMETTNDVRCQQAVDQQTVARAALRCAFASRSAATPRRPEDVTILGDSVQTVGGYVPPASLGGSIMPSADESHAQCDVGLVRAALLARRTEQSVFAAPSGSPNTEMEVVDMGGDGGRGEEGDAPTHEWTEAAPGSPERRAMEAVVEACGAPGTEVQGCARAALLERNGKAHVSLQGNIRPQAQTSNRSWRVTSLACNSTPQSFEVT